MAGLLDFLSTPDAQLGMGLLAASGPSTTPMNAFQRIQMAQEGMTAQKAQAMKLKLYESQIEENKSQDAERKAKAQALAAQQQALGGAWGPDGKLDVQRLVRAGYPIKDIEALSNLGRSKVARTVDTMIDGKPVSVQYDDYGNQVGQALPQWKAPMSVDRGGSVGLHDPVTGEQRATFSKEQTPDSRAADARAQEASANGRIPSGYRPGQNGALEFIPGGPADPANRPGGAKALTEDQGKATGWLVQAENAYKNMLATGFDANGKPKGAAVPGLSDGIAALPYMGGVGNAFRPADRQQFLQGASSLSEALLRAATGAGVNKDEAAQKVKELTPQFGDSDKVIKQKIDSIPLYIESLKVRAGSGAEKAGDIGQSAPPKDLPKSKFIDVGGQREAARLAPDGFYYVQRNGKTYKVNE